MKKHIKYCLCASLVLFCGNVCGKDLKINVLGCVLSLPDSSDITVTGSANITFLFRRQEALPLETINIIKYPGDAAWYAADTEAARGRTTHSKHSGFDEKTITASGIHLPGVVSRGLTDGKVVVFFNGPDLDIDQFLNCGR